MNKHAIRTIKVRKGRGKVYWKGVYLAHVTYELKTNQWVWIDDQRERPGAVKRSGRLWLQGNAVELLEDMLYSLYLLGREEFELRVVKCIGPQTYFVTLIPG